MLLTYSFEFIGTMLLSGAVSGYYCGKYIKSYFTSI